MIWIGAIIGFLIGLNKGYLPDMITLTLVGAIVGKFTSYLLSLKKTDTNNLKEQIEALNSRLIRLEEKLGIEQNDSTYTTTQDKPSEITTPASGDTETSIEGSPIATEESTTKTVLQHRANEQDQSIPPLISEPVQPEQEKASATENESETDSQTIAASVTHFGDKKEKESAGISTRDDPPWEQPQTFAEPSKIEILIKRWIFGGNPVVKIGVLILFLGLAFLLRYAAQHAVFPIEMRYAGVAIAGIALLILGWRWRLKQDNYGLVLQGAGIAVLYLTTLAAMKLHPMLSASVGFAILFSVAAFAALLAILQDSFILAMISTLGGFATPVLASTGSGNHIALFSYMALLNLGITAIAWFKAWRALNLVGFVCTFALGSAWANKYYHTDLFPSTEPFLLLFLVLYVLITFLFARRVLSNADAPEGNTFTEQVQQSIKSIGYVDGSLAFGVPISAFWLQYLLTRHIEYGTAFSALGFGLLYIVLAMLLFRRTGMRYILLTETMIALGVVFGSLAIPLMEKPWTSAAWAVEAAGVFWVGIRQERVHARLFALLLLIGSSTYYFTELRAGTETVLSGSLLSCLLLAASSAWIVRLMLRVEPQELSALEIRVRPLLIGFASFFLGLSPLQVLSAEWAAPVVALMGAGLIYLSLRINERVILYWAWIYQISASVLFITTLRSSPSGTVLSNGWSGLFAASLIGISMLLGVWLMFRFGRSNDNEEEEEEALVRDKSASIALLVGLAFINLAPLFILPWKTAALVWPVTGFMTLLWAIRAGHIATILFALALQVISGFAHLGGRTIVFGHQASSDTLDAFRHIGYWGPVLIAIAAFACARLLQRVKRPALETTLGWVALLWGGAWWGFAWLYEVARIAPAKDVSAFLVLTTIASIWILGMLARRWQWTEAGQATLTYLPLLVLIAIMNWLSGYYHPFAAWGALAWPLALVVHGLLLRRQETWSPPNMLELTHICGAWLFVIMTAMEVRWQFAQLGQPDSTWRLLGWMIVPVVYLLMVTRTTLQSRWPIRDFYQAYLVKSSTPIVVYLLAWIWLTNIISNGNATPLPYVTLLNPLEIAQVAVLLSLGLWWLSVREQDSFAKLGNVIRSVTVATTFAIITGMVVRSCHHWTSVPWNFDMLFKSTTVQTSLSIVWSILAISLMIFANRHRQRKVWITGAGLMAVVVSKLFLIELAATGSLARIVSFIVVGLLLLLVGYFAPLPPKIEINDEDKETVTA